MFLECLYKWSCAPTPSDDAGMDGLASVESVDGVTSVTVAVQAAAGMLLVSVLRKCVDDESSTHIHTLISLPHLCTALYRRAPTSDASILPLCHMITAYGDVVHHRGRDIGEANVNKVDYLVWGAVRGGLVGRCMEGEVRPDDTVFTTLVECLRSIATRVSSTSSFGFHLMAQKWNDHALTILLDRVLRSKREYGVMEDGKVVRREPSKPICAVLDLCVLSDVPWATPLFTTSPRLSLLGSLISSSPPAIIRRVLFILKLVKSKSRGGLPPHFTERFRDVLTALATTTSDEEDETQEKRKADGGGNDHVVIFSAPGGADVVMDCGPTKGRRDFMDGCRTRDLAGEVLSEDSQ
ncbi:hypothetical protein HK104_010698 [Borealophlyctis nickersoniae]|nr:hypothetical protein HK104_010698 [Borealophlyctis nickersoniae]